MAAAMALLTTAVTFVPTPAPAAAAEAGVACNIVTGADRPSQQVARLYKAVFRRPPEPEGWNYWKGVIATTSLFDIAAYFVTAPEFVNLYGSATNDEFVRLIYQNVMGREPDPEGYQYWLGVLNRDELTRADMVVYFSESSEFKRRENDLYIERCDAVVDPNPWLVLSDRLIYGLGGGGTLYYEYNLSLNGADGGSTHSFNLDPRVGSSYIGRRMGGASCVTWRPVDQQVAYHAASDTGMENVRAWDLSNSGPGHLLVDQGAQTRERVTKFEDWVELRNFYASDSCSPESGDLLTLAAPRFELVPESSALEVTKGLGMARKVHFFDTEGVRALLGSGDRSLETLIPSLSDDLGLVDQRNAELRAAGQASRATDRIEVTLTAWEDHTGNLLQVQAAYLVYLTADDLRQWEWREQLIVWRVPSW